MKQSNNKTFHSELFFGIVGPTGSDHKMVIDILRTELEQASYTVVTIKLSQHLQIFNDDLKSATPKYQHIEKHMKAGTQLREDTERGDILALISIAKIAEERKKIDNIGIAYILDSLKHPDEVNTLRSVYGNLFSVISVYAPREKRIYNLSKNLVTSNGKSESKQCQSKAIELINRDEDEKNKWGQRVKDTFPLGDLFIDTRTRKSVSDSIIRYIQLLFRYPYHTPTKDEMCIAMASHASLRSADLSRQVGAVIATEHAEIIALGCNEVPKYGGGYIGLMSQIIEIFN